MTTPANRLLQWATGSDGLHRVFALAVVIVCLCAYGLALGGPLFFDDIPNLSDNVLLKIDGHDFDDWRVAIISNDAGLFHRPLSMFTFALNYVAAGDFSPAVLKATNLAIHLLIGLLIYRLCRALLRAPVLSASTQGNACIVALIAAALWLLHPLHVSTVLYAIQRMAQMSTILVVLGLWVFVRYRLRWAEIGASTGELIAACLWLMIISVLAVLSKENGALLLWLVAVVEATLFRGVWCGQRKAPLVILGWTLLLLPVILVALILLISPETLSGRFSAREFSLQERLLTEGRVLWQYLSWIILPNITAMGFFHDDMSVSRSLWAPLTTVVSLLAWVGTIAGAIMLRNKFPLLLFALLFFLAAHSMESTVLPLELVFEHRNYLPSIGVCLLVAAVLVQVSARFNGLRLRVSLVIVLGVLSAQLGIRSFVWADAMSLAQFNVINHPASPRANFYYGNALFERYTNAGELGLDDEEKKSLAVASRSYFARMRALDETSLAALVMLYQLDTLRFPGLAQENDWLAHIESAALSKRIRPSDRTAMGALVTFSQSDPGQPDSARVGLILDRLIARYPNYVDLLAMQYRFLAAQPDADNDQLRGHLQRATQQSTKNRLLYVYMIQYHGSDDMAVTYDSIRAWMKLDTRRQELSVIRRIFKH